MRSILTILGTLSVLTAPAEEVVRDIVIYGSSPAAITAAIAAGKQGRSAVIVSPERRIGGLTTGGLGQTDIGRKEAFGGLALEFYRDVAVHYRKPESWTRQKRADYLPDGQCSGTKGEDSMWTFEPSAALAILEGWERKHGLDIRRGEWLDRGRNGVTKEGDRIVAFRTLSGNVYRGRVFVDATYEGDLMAAAGVSYHIGREDNGTYGEALNGTQVANAKFHNFVDGVDPYVVKGDTSSGLLPGIEPGPIEADGTGDRRVQAYCFRMCLTDVPENRIPFAKPEGYDERDYELLFRNYEAGEQTKRPPWINSKMPNRKTDTNNCRGFSTDFVGQNRNWPEAGYEERAEILKAHLKYQRGLMWTLANHPRIPEAVRKEVSRWGTCRDEFADGLGDGWQSQLYVREARRMVGGYVMTEANCRGTRVASRPVAMAAYTMDSHNVRRYVTKDGWVKNEGDVEVHEGKGPFGIDYGSLVPKRGECANLLVPVCLSASHIAFGSIRMEPVFFALGQSAGTAAALAVEGDRAVQDVDYAALRDRLLAAGQVLAVRVAEPGEKKDECPHWISVMPLAADDAEGIAADAVAQGNETIIDGIAWIMSLCPAGNPAADLAARYAADYRLIEPSVRARSKVKQGVLLQSTMGHAGFPGEATPWQLSVKADGTSVYRMCPLDPRFLDYIARSCRTLAALKPDFFMVDDDTRLHWNGVLGCFCPLHLAALEKATGRAWTREEAVKLAKAGDADFLGVWEKVYFDSMAAFFRTIRANFDPATPGILCTVSAAAHFKHAKTFAEMLAAPGQVPVVRGNGANYGGNDVYHCIERRAGFAKQLGDVGPGVVFLQEADTCPQQLWSCSATREYESMVLQTLEGVKGAKIWITRTAMTRERRSQAAYRRILAANRGVLEWAAKADFRQVGVVVPNVGVGDYIREWSGWAERYLALTGIPYRYGEASAGEVTALCAATLTRLGRAEIERILSGAVLLDGTGANWLAANGFADLIGADARPWARKTIQRHLDENGVSLGGMRVDGEFADLTALRPGAEVLSRLYNVPSRGAEPAYEAPGAIAFTNARGGRVIACALPLRESMPAYYNHTLFSESYQAWIVRLVERLGGRLPVRFAGAGPVLCEAGRTTAEGDVFVLNPLDVDDLVEPEMAFARPPVSVERLMGDGSWKAVRFEAETTGFVRLKDTVRAKNPTVYRWK